MRTLLTRGLACLVSLIMISSPAASRSLPSSDRPGVNTQSAPGAYTISMTTQYIEEKMDEFGAVGLSIALVSQDGVVWEEGFGWADKENEIEATPESVYMIGSVSKFLTALSLVRLHEQGVVNLDNPATDYLPEFQMADRYGDTLDQITVRRLLNHHSGIPGDIYTGGFLMGTTWDNWDCSLYSDWIMDYLATDYPSLPPGEMGVYSNIGFVLAGEIALAVDGLGNESFGDYMDRVLFDPLEMDHTSLYTIDENMTYGYYDGYPIEHLQTNCSFGATGGVYSTVQDMGRVIFMILNQGQTQGGETFLATETVDLLGESEKSALDINSYMVFGLGLDSVSDPIMSYAGRTWAKNGSTGHYNAFMEILPDMNLGVIVLANSNTAEQLVYAVARECLKNALFDSYGMTASFPDLDTPDSVADSSRIQGIYAKGSGWDEIQANEDGSLTWIQNAQNDDPGSETLVFDGTAYIAQTSGANIRFAELTRDTTDYFAMVQSGASTSQGMEIVFGEKLVRIIGNQITQPDIPDAWDQRQGLYVIDNRPWNEYPDWSFPFAALSEKDGFLLWSSHNEVLLPDTDTLAYVAGVNNRNDSAMRAITQDGMEKLLVNGYRMQSIDQIPAITAGETVSGTVDIFDSDWYRFDAGENGQTVTVTVTDGSEYYLTLFDGAYTRLARETESISWTVSEPGTYYFYISPTPDADQTYTLTLTVE